MKDQKFVTILQTVFFFSLACCKKEDGYFLSIPKNISALFVLSGLHDHVIKSFREFLNQLHNFYDSLISRNKNREIIEH